jgi:RNA polymerase sigma factor (sigma-70 family)
VEIDPQMLVDQGVNLKWQLTERALGLLLRSLASDENEAAAAYLRLQTNLARFFEVRGLGFADVAVDEVINRLARKLDEGQTIANPSTYALGIARMYALELRRSPQARTSYDLPEVAIAAVEPEDDQSAAMCLDRCLSTLDLSKRELITRYYEGEMSAKIANRQKLSAELGIPPNALRNRAVRVRQKLEACITECVKENCQ